MAFNSLNPLAEALKIKDLIIGWRREFHAYPELGFEEFRTSQIVEENLRSWGYKVRRVGTGVIADLSGGDGLTIALRADMDALPIQEENDVPYRSKVPGKMHACGHDAHVAMLLGAAKIIAEFSHILPNKVRLIFQPAEETVSGALRMVEGGAVDGVDFIFGIHVWADLPSGVIGLKEGAFLAGAGSFDIRIVGKGGHGAAPHEAIDPIPIAAQAILAFQTIVSRFLNPLEKGVVSVCSVKAGEAHNVIPNDVVMKGTYRFYSDSVAKLIERKVDEILKGLTSAYGATYELRMERTALPVINDSKAISYVKKVAEALNVKTFEIPATMASEDFSEYLQRVPGAFIALGVKNESKGIIYPHHHPKFNLDEDALPIGTALEVGLVFHDYSSY
ncbi:MAG: peptidase M20 [Zestosphaera tikiterensis]|uniref:Peptidase M20 n=1 Tax=Zestosphaera tikiterensis TaxID=1973259 RepID=A0A2R7Y3V9_9CREN|nr:MAG: peptidase M20 [Zestosphaera tikiterensis]